MNETTEGLDAAAETVRRHRVAAESFVRDCLRIFGQPEDEALIVRTATEVMRVTPWWKEARTAGQPT